MARAGENNMIQFIRSKRYIITIILALAAIAIEYYYSICGDACSYLRGDIFGIPLQYIGIGYMAALIALAILKKDTLLIILLSAGVGIEAYLVGFQIWYATYCDYCLAFAAALVLQFIVNCDWKRKRLIVAAMVAALVLFSIVFRGSATPAYADDSPLSAFGNGKTAVRLYTDYFCSPCKEMAPSLEPVVTALVKNNIVTFTFIDTPFYQLSSLYARYFLYALNEKKDLGHGLAVRNALIEASNQKIDDAAKLEAFLNTKGIKIKSFDVKPTFDMFIRSLRDDKAKATPSCVIEKDGKKETFVGGFDIIQALQKLKK
ncbi:MAG TPA: thioredoxin domain-containing protein [Syntrophorhabdaceae bacterium]|nr:thioredoxin domain-containing protein [Syntrophorhabdaceae bacterium]HQM81156.1 thioredoxin domain-containing protein [Syntrophorhabdaceae bacterium]HQM82458.1 thioredoxin domain-containing protein [Syntrophorhabdaceae bacterium]